jgi:hypothetical protein
MSSLARLRSLLIAALVAVTLLSVVPANAITGGSPDGNGHPNIGALVANFPFGSFPICSGTLISPTAFLTPGHCIFFSQLFGATGYSVSFDSTLTFDSTGTRTTPPRQAPSPSTPASGTTRVTSTTKP